MIAEDGVVAIVALEHQRFSILLRQQAMAAAEIPTTRTLAKISADGCDVADLRAGRFTRGRSQHGVLMLYLSRGGDSIQRNKGAQMCRAALVGDDMQTSRMLDVHQAFGRGDLIFH